MSNTYLSKEVWESQISGREISDCSVRSECIIVLCVRKIVSPEDASEMWDHDILARMMVINFAADRNLKSLKFCALDKYEREHFER